VRHVRAAAQLGVADPLPRYRRERQDWEPIDRRWSGVDIRTDEGLIEAYVFERNIESGGIEGIKSGLASAPGVRFVGQFVGAFNLFARVVAADLGELQRRISGEYFDAGVHSDWSLNLTGPRLAAPKRHSPDICAMVCARTSVDPFGLLDDIDELFADVGDYGAAVVNAPDFDVLVDLGAATIEEVVDRVVQLRKVRGIKRTATAFADLTNAIRVAAG
jgi:hypothetical protein